jgi:hypothetical protein
MLDNREGELAVFLARKTIEEYLDTGKRLDPETEKLSSVFRELRGVFVTLNKKGVLRGCIGHPYPDLSLQDALVDSAISAASRDPRFPAVSLEEMSSITIEVSVLTPPERINAPLQKLPDLIEIGKHGLIVKQGLYQGLLLPQVAPENGFDAVDFLSHTCLKAGLSPDAWLTGAEVFWFTGQIFVEKTPTSEVMEKHF